MARVFVKRFSPEALYEDVREALEWLDWKDLISSNTRVFVKPNLTWHIPTPGVTTTPDLIDAMVKLLTSRTSHVIVGESDGGYHSFKAEEAFLNHGLYEMAKKYNFDVVNLSRVPSEKVKVHIGSRQIELELPSMLLHEIDVFVTLPVPKVHVMTGVSLAFKNQWGCIPQTMRLRNHSEFDEKVIGINKLLNPRIVVFDGTYFLDLNGPMIGEAVPMNLLIVGDDPGASSLVCCEIMNLDPWEIRHFRLAQREGLMPGSLEEVILNQDISPFKFHHFHLERTLLNWVALLGFRHSLALSLFYDSKFGDLLHKILYFIRRNPIVARLLYGKFGYVSRE
jgi:uncharacterized protein (DUF362 family)